LKRFKKQLDKDGTLKEFKERQYFKKPSLRKHEQMRELRHKIEKAK
jgi:ribosomal protein S21